MQIQKHISGMVNEVNTVAFKGTVSPAQNRLKVVWFDRTWSGHPLLRILKFFYVNF